MRELRDLGADGRTIVSTSNHDTALHLAARAGMRVMMKWLFNQGRVDPWATNKDGDTAKDVTEICGQNGCAISLRLATPGTTFEKSFANGSF